MFNQANQILFYDGYVDGTVDGYHTKYRSPWTVDSTGLFAPIPPVNAVNFTVRCSNQYTLAHSSNAALGVFTVLAGTEKTIPCSDGKTIYVGATPGSIIHYYFSAE